MKPNFKCPKCKQMVCVGKHLHASYHCPKCGYGMVLTAKERQQGYKDYKPNFMVMYRTPRENSRPKQFTKPFKKIDKQFINKPAEN